MLDSETYRNDYTQAEAETQYLFYYTFKIFDDDEIAVYIDDILQTKDVTYKVTGVGEDAGGTISFGYLDGDEVWQNDPPSAGAEITLIRTIPYTQTLSIPAHSPFNSENLEESLDRLVMMIQQLSSYSSDGSVSPLMENFLSQTTEAGARNILGYQPGTIIQVVTYETGAVATGTTPMPNDDTIPQNTEGDQYMTLAITPKSATNNLIISVVWVGANNYNGADTMTVALFKDTTANALAAVQHSYEVANRRVSLNLNHIMAAGTTTVITFKVRAGIANAGTTTFNGSNAGRLLGGVMASSIIIAEVQV